MICSTSALSGEWWGCHRLEFYAGGERKPWRVFTISDTFVPEVYWLPSFPGLPRQSEFSCCSLFCKQDLPQPPSHKKGKMPQNHYPKSSSSGTFSACKCVQFESPGLFFHLLWYAYLIHCPRLDLIWCTPVQGWWWATSEGPNVLFSLFYLLAHCSDLLCFLVVLFAHEMLRTFQLIGYE